MAIDIVTSSDPRFADLNKGRANGRFPTPQESASEIDLCHSGEDVAAAVEKAVHAGKRPTILSGGHCYEDFVFNNPGGAIIDVRPMAGISQDPATKRWKIEAGATVGEMYKGMYDQGNVTIPAASCTTVGVGGHISGGGYGFLTRLYGIAPDWISAVDIVTVDHKGKVQLRRVDKKTDPDLLRACRGSGGGSFGVITAYYSDNPPPAPKEILGVNVRFDWGDMTPERLHRILYLYSSYWDTRGRDKDTWGLFTIMNMNPGSTGRSPSIGFGGMFTNLDGTVDDTKVLEEFLSVFEECKPVSQIVHHPNDPGAEHLPDPSGPVNIVCLATVMHNAAKRSWIDYSGANRTPGQFGGGSPRPPARAVTPGAPNMPAGPPPGGTAIAGRPGGAGRQGFANRPQRRQKYKSAYMRKPYTIEEARVIFNHLTQADPYGGASIAMDSFGGAASKQEMLEETSDAHRSSIIKMQMITGWTDPAEDQQRMASFERFYTDLFSASGDGKHKGTPAFNDRTEGCYINYPDEDMLKYDYWTQLYWGNGKLYPFLQHVKKKYDPNNVFHHAMSVRT